MIIPFSLYVGKVSNKSKNIFNIVKVASIIIHYSKSSHNIIKITSMSFVSIYLLKSDHGFLLDHLPNWLIINNFWIVDKITSEKYN